MKAWRIMRSAYVGDPLSGVGAAQFGGRWNSTGVAMIYTSTSRPLAVLEMLVHMPRENTSLDALLLPLEVPDHLIVELGDLPEGWNSIPHGKSSHRAGDRWIEQGSSLALLVPSAVLRSERNILINPAHGQLGKVRVGEPELHAFDKRLFGLK